MEVQRQDHHHRLPKGGVIPSHGLPVDARKAARSIPGRLFPIRPQTILTSIPTCRLHREIFKTILDSCSADFSREKAARAPFTVSEKILPETNSGYVEYGSSAVLPDGTLYAVRKSLDKSACLVRISPSGNIERVSGFTSGTASRLIWSESLQRLFWSETTSDKRWKQRKTNDIRYYDARTGNTKSLTGGDNLFSTRPCLRTASSTCISCACPPRKIFPDKITRLTLEHGS